MKRPIRRLTPAKRIRLEEPIDHAVELIEQVCRTAGSSTLLDDLVGNTGGQDLRELIASEDTARIYDWLVTIFSFQGISDRVAADYITKHGSVTFEQPAAALRAPTCPKLKSFWHFQGCRYDKISGTCAEPEHVATCSLPSHNLRNGRLNQTAYSLFLFIRDVANGDLINWIDNRLTGLNGNELSIDDLQRNLIEPMFGIFGVADKVLNMALSSVLLAAPASRPRWRWLGANLITVDTLVHNFLHRTGILSRFGADHAFGAACYSTGGCASIIRQVAGRIDARQFNPDFPAEFPRFVQHAIWRFCAMDGLNICNGNRIKDSRACENIHCRLFPGCDRRALRPLKKP